jgi:hypothetical protein
MSNADQVTMAAMKLAIAADQSNGFRDATGH